MINKDKYCFTAECISNTAELFQLDNEVNLNILII